MQEIRSLEPEAQELLQKLKSLAGKGPVPAMGHGDTSVGVTLLHDLDVPMTSLSKAQYKGIVITARRGSKAKDLNRVNLFAKVPDWGISACKSTRELLDRCGYDRDGERRLNCTVRARIPNSQGLFLEVDHANGWLREKQSLPETGVRDLVAWNMSDLEQRLIQKQPASAWIVAVPSKHDGQDYFHYRYVTFTARPRASELGRLLETGTVTVDHLITDRGGKTVEKGPLFKIKPSNVEALFPSSPSLDLLRI
ncbi:MvaI/BcnI family restriction endonuclease [Aliiruegeria lutimaris]|uniref:MvaI/BcnI restriction endonuclease family protein n=1 Tax=Aliiruegeria lutimaris TaxID=571298 RepID=A0A1G8UYV0_9RHOB|nr:MvaI/BcnI family restriction endonuclease [Aliiruegeria lutimaris]SDJ58757.1 MvaI/BcnI restriction endonuclease family protein [Aliiruegeria lutimaris]